MEALTQSGRPWHPLQPMPKGVRRAVCTVSGGYDSAAALLWSMHHCPTVGIFIDYGQPYIEQERRAVKELVALGCVAENKHWEGIIEVTMTLGTLEGTPWIPFRNLNIAAACANYAAIVEASAVVFGSKSVFHRPEDPISYLDSTAAFYSATQRLLRDFTGAQRQDKVPQFVLPLLGWDKKDVLRYLLRAGVPLELLWNCYRTDGVAAPCGECEHCTIMGKVLEEVRGERRAQFLAGE